MPVIEKQELVTAQITIRNLFSGQLRAVMEIEKDSFIDPWSQDWFETFILSRQISWGAFLGRTLVGYLLATQEEATLHIVNIAVHRDYRRNGIGRIMMKKLYELAHRSLSANITLEVRRSNQLAISFYKGEGFMQIYASNGYYADGEDALIFRLSMR